MPYADPDEKIEIRGHTDRPIYCWQATRGRPGFDQVMSTCGRAPTRRAAVRRAHRALRKPRKYAWTTKEDQTLRARHGAGPADEE